MVSACVKVKNAATFSKRRKYLIIASTQPDGKGSATQAMFGNIIWNRIETDKVTERS